MHTRTRRTALAAFVLTASVGVGLTGCSLLLPQQQASRDDAGEVVEGGQESAFSMKVGDCWNDVVGNEVTDVPLVPCSEPHDNEVYAEFTLPDGEFPGDEVVEAAAFDGCYDRFADYVGLAYEESILDIYPLWPTEGSWDELGDRVITCSLWDTEAQLTGSAKDSQR